MIADLQVSAKNAKEVKVEESHASKADFKVSTFKDFRQAFTQQLSLPYFGEKDIYSVDQHSKSAGAKELQKSGAKDVLLKAAFLRRVHRLLREYARLVQEQKKVCQVSADLGRSIKKYRDDQKTLRSLQKGIAKFITRQKKEHLLAAHVLDHLEKARKELRFVEDVFADVEKTQASYVHPEMRRKHDTGAPRTKYEISKFKPLLPQFDYELHSMRKKAPMQWLLATLDLELRRSFRCEQKEVTEITRYRVISSILKSAGLKPIPALTIKELLTNETLRKNALARNSRVS
jgi:hypothetical protein